MNTFEAWIDAYRWCQQHAVGDCVVVLTLRGLWEWKHKGPPGAQLRPIGSGGRRSREEANV